jgi:hypothetical protein
MNADTIVSPHIYTLVAEDLATENLQLEQRITELEGDVVAYREISQQAIAALHDLTRKHRAQSERVRALAREYRAFRERILRQDAERRAA